MTKSPTVGEIVDLISNKNKKWLAKGLSIVEDDPVKSREMIALCLPKIKQSQIVGITGSPGTGKSSLVNKLIDEFVSKGMQVGVIAVDPSSPFTGGAILGDRIRVMDNKHLYSVFFRSMASRGHLGGLSAVTYNAVRLYQLFGFDIIIVETVGAGQSEVEVMELCDTTLVVSVPGLGDGIQALKAGIMEIADIFVVNKSDKSGAEQLKNQIENLIHMSEQTSQPKVLMTNALSGEGVKELSETILNHFEMLKETNLLNLKEQIRKKRDIQNFLSDIASRKILSILNDSKLIDIYPDYKKIAAQFKNDFCEGNELDQ